MEKKKETEKWTKKRNREPQNEIVFLGTAFSRTNLVHGTFALSCSSAASNCACSTLFNEFDRGLKMHHTVGVHFEERIFGQTVALQSSIRSIGIQTSE